MRTLVVVQTGPQSTLQDLGRAGYADIGIGQGGAADRAAARRANRLVGNDEGAVVVESLLGGLFLYAESDLVVALTGAPAGLTVGERPASVEAPVRVPAGTAVRVGTPVAGLRTYLAVAGGIDAPTVLGSASTNPTGGVGPDPLAAGQRLTVGAPHGEAVGSVVPGSTQGWGGTVTARIIPGPRDDWFTPESVRAFYATTWTTSSDLDRVGVRLQGPVLERARSGELLSEGTVRGAVQVPPNGQPVVFLADYPTTGGYPVIGCVVFDDVDRLAQLRPGDEVRFLRAAPPFTR